jgi:hypothetical protein
LIALAACGSPRPVSPLAGMDVAVSTVEWRAKPGDPGQVEISIVVDGYANKVGTIEGTPESCAMRRAEAKATELVCGRGESFAAELEPGELVVTRTWMTEQGPMQREVKRVPTGPSQALTVSPYALPVPEAPKGEPTAP